MKWAGFWVHSSHGSSGLLLLSKMYPVESRTVKLSYLRTVLSSVALYCTASKTLQNHPWYWLLVLLRFHIFYGRSVSVSFGGKIAGCIRFSFLTSDGCVRHSLLVAWRLLDANSAGDGHQDKTHTASTINACLVQAWTAWRRACMVRTDWQTAAELWHLHSTLSCPAVRTDVAGRMAWQEANLHRTSSLQHCRHSSCIDRHRQTDRDKETEIKLKCFTPSACSTHTLVHIAGHYIGLQLLTTAQQWLGNCAHCRHHHSWTCIISTVAINIM